MENKLTKEEHLKNFRESSLRLSDYCRKTGLPTSTLGTWLSKEKKKAICFKPVQIINPKEESFFIFKITEGFKIELSFRIGL